MFLSDKEKLQREQRKANTIILEITATLLVTALSNHFLKHRRNLIIAFVSIC